MINDNNAKYLLLHDVAEETKEKIIKNYSKSKQCNSCIIVYKSMLQEKIKRNKCQTLLGIKFE